MSRFGLLLKSRAAIAFAAAAIFVLGGAMAPAAVSAAAGHRKAVPPLNACLSTPKGHTESGKQACIEAAVEGTTPADICLSAQKGHETYYGTVDCLSAELDRTYFKLNRVSADLGHRLPPPQARSLRREQKGWFAQRDRICTKHDLRFDVLMCMIDKNLDRTEQLQRRLKRLPPRGR
ncbi:MAG: Lysozyme inhibitor LprI [Sphingomonadales bacterium]|jgi:uncharacterized protein YecT (DUF1311 family)|nr:Lysozyme inhibitor LprI [Sphingomonadales bacterium]